MNNNNDDDRLELGQQSVELERRYQMAIEENNNNDTEEQETSLYFVTPRFSRYRYLLRMMDTVNLLFIVWAGCMFCIFLLVDESLAVIGFSLAAGVWIMTFLILLSKDHYRYTMRKNLSPLTTRENREGEDSRRQPIDQ